jgi:hypothetical protein
MLDSKLYFVRFHSSLMMEAVRTSETSVDNHFTRQYIPEDSSERKLYFRCHIDFVYSHALRTLGLTRYVTYNFSSSECLVVLYNSLIRSKLEYASVVWNKLSLTDFNKIENIERKFANLCYYLSFQADF